MYLNWLRRNSNHDYCKKKPKVTGILRNYSIPAVINNLGGNNDGTYTSYVSLHGRHARFAMPAMFGASAAKGR
jgi:hypothetical protein